MIMAPNLPSIFPPKRWPAPHAKALAHLDTKRAATRSLYSGRADGDTHFNTDCNSDFHANAHPYCYAHTDATIIGECRGHQFRVPGWVSRGVSMHEGGCYLSCY